MKIDYSDWKFMNDMYAPFENKSFIYSYKVIEVPVSLIKGLTRYGILKQQKLDNLIQSINEKGFSQRNYPADLYLVLFPSGEYSVESGGNHRTYLARKLGYKTLIGFVDIIVPFSLLSTIEIETVNSMQNYENQQKYLETLCQKYKLIPSYSSPPFNS